MAHCLSCHSYVIYESAICGACYERDNPLRVVHKQEWDFRYKMIKGKIAETIVEQLFLLHKYNVYRYGVEHTLPGIAELIRKKTNDTARFIRKTPDFVVQHRLSNEVYFVEVKFRANGCYTANELPKNYPYNDALIVLVSPWHIKCLSAQELKNGKEITPDCNNYLADRSEFELRRDVVVEFCKYAESFYAGVRN